MAFNTPPVDDRTLSDLKRMEENDTLLLEAHLEFLGITGSEGLERLARALEKTSSLRRLVIRAVIVTNSSLIEALEAVAQNGFITDLALLLGVADDPVVSKVADLLATSRLPPQLAMDGVLGSDRAVVLAEGLSKNTSVTNLNLATRRLGGRGLVALGDALGAASSLQALELAVDSPPPIPTEAVDRFADALASNPSLQEFRFFSPDVGDQAARSLSRALASNTSLNMLGLDMCGLSAAAAGPLSRLLRANSTLTALHLKGSGAIAGATEPLLAALRRFNYSLLQLCWSGQTPQELGALMKRNRRFRDDRFRIRRLLAPWRTAINVRKYRKYLRRELRQQGWSLGPGAR